MLIPADSPAHRRKASKRMEKGHGAHAPLTIAPVARVVRGRSQSAWNEGALACRREDPGRINTLTFLMQRPRKRKCTGEEDPLDRLNETVRQGRTED